MLIVVGGVAGGTKTKSVNTSSATTKVTTVGSATTTMTAPKSQIDPKIHSHTLLFGLTSELEESPTTERSPPSSQIWIQREGRELRPYTMDARGTT